MYSRLLVHEVYKAGYKSVQARLMGASHSRSRRGRIVSWRIVRTAIVNAMKVDRRLVLTTMVDYHGLPQTRSSAWPERSNSSSLPHAQRANPIKELLLEDIQDRMGPKFDSRRFIPFVMMHEFEALLFSDCYRFASAINERDLGPSLQEILDAHNNPEEIDDSPNSALSKRIVRLVPNYDKRVMEVDAAREVGIPAMRAACPHFATWWNRLVRHF